MSFINEYIINSLRILFKNLSSHRCPGIFCRWTSVIDALAFGRYYFENLHPDIVLKSRDINR